MTSQALRAVEQNQRAAADPETSVFVTANAGSGKTKVLVDRIARLLLAGARPSAFLCITYTKAAASEMQRRLFDRLGGWCVAGDGDLASELDKLGAGGADLGRARALFAQALETPGGLKIQTIHAFCERLLARFPVEAGVPPGFEIADETRAAALLGEARAQAALAPSAPAEAFERFAEALSSDNLFAFLDRLALRRADFHRFALKHGGGVFAEAALRNRHGVRANADSLAQAFVARQDWARLKEAAAALLASSKADQKVGERLQGALSAAAGASSRMRLEACFAFAFSSSGEPYKKLITAALKKSHPWVEDDLNRLMENCVQAREHLNAIERAEDSAAALRLALMLDDAYATAKDRAGVLDFDDLIECAQGLLTQSNAAPWVLYKLDGGLDHILIDEGQDTSPGQWDLIAPLQQEFFSGAGVRPVVRTMFAVGDPKQSIYGFQGADPARFLSEAQRLSKVAAKAGVRFKGPTLQTSFRSTPEVLRVVDETFARRPLVVSAPTRDDISRHLPARADQSGCVEVWPLMLRPERPEGKPWDAPMDVELGASVHVVLARAVARRVRDMIDAREAVWDRNTPRPMNAGDVLALVRTRGPLFRELIKAFKRVGLPVAGADRMVLREELAVEDCMALMRVALDPADDLSLACVLKGPWCNLNDDDLLKLAHGRAPGETLLSRLLRSEDHPAASTIVRDAIERRGADAFAFLSWALETPHGGGATGWMRVFSRLGAEARDPLEEVLQRALKSPGHQGATLQRFLSSIELDAGQVKRELEAESGAVRVMTVHGAKGLEAPVVILPDTTAPVAEKPDDGLLFDPSDGPFVSFRSSDDDERVRGARDAYKARMTSEHWRLLYVAMTRARDRLIVCGAQHGNTRVGESEHSWRAAVEDATKALGAAPCETPCGEGLRFGEPITAPVREGATAPVEPVPGWARREAPGAKAVSIAAPSKVSKIDPALFSPRGDGQRRFRRGRLIHQLLERLPDVAVDRREVAAREWLKRQGVAETDADLFASEALAVLNDERFAFIFGPQSRAEAPIIGEAAGRPVRGVVDRLAIDDTRVIVLDFKTDRPAPKDAAAAPEAYVLQLALYRQVLRQIFPAKAVTCCLLWTESPHLMELPDQRLTDVFDAFARG